MKRKRPGRIKHNDKNRDKQKFLANFRVMVRHYLKAQGITSPDPFKRLPECLDQIADKKLAGHIRTVLYPPPREALSKELACKIAPKLGPFDYADVMLYPGSEAINRKCPLGNQIKAILRRVRGR